jgi:hypothetical protein
VSLVSAGTKAFNQLNVPLKTTLTHFVFNNSAGAANTIQDKLVNQLRAKIEKEQQI